MKLLSIKRKLFKELGYTEIYLCIFNMKVNTLYRYKSVGGLRWVFHMYKKPNTGLRRLLSFTLNPDVVF